MVLLGVRGPTATFSQKSTTCFCFHPKVPLFLTPPLSESYDFRYLYIKMRSLSITDLLPHPLQHVKHAAWSADDYYACHFIICYRPICSFGPALTLIWGRICPIIYFVLSFYLRDDLCTYTLPSASVALLSVKRFPSLSSEINDEKYFFFILMTLILRTNE